MNYSIAVPWQVYVCSFDGNYHITNLQFFYAKGPIVDLDHQLYHAPLFNIFADDKICMPARSTYRQNPKTIASLMNECYSAVWNSSFNFDLYSNINSMLFDKNKELILSLGYNTFTYHNAIPLFSKMTLDEVMEFEFLPSAQIRPYIENIRSQSMVSTLRIRGL